MNSLIGCQLEVGYNAPYNVSLETPFGIQTYIFEAYAQERKTTSLKILILILFVDQTSSD